MIVPRKRYVITFFFLILSKIYFSKKSKASIKLNIKLQIAAVKMVNSIFRNISFYCIVLISLS